LRSFVKLAPLFLALLATGCSVSFCLPNTFAREFPLYSGDVRGRAVTEDGDAAAFAHVRVQGANVTRRADSAGHFRVWDLDEGPWVLRIDEDNDGDGVAERQRVITAVLRRTNVQRTLIETSENLELTGVDVGEVVLQGTATVRGNVYLSPAAGAAGVPPAQLGRNALVVAGRNLDLPRIGGGGSDLVSLGAERKTGVDATGAFELRNVVGGPVFLLVLVYDGPVGDPANLVQVSEPIFVRADGATATDPLILDTPIVLPPPATSPPQTTIQVVISPAPPERSQAFLTLVPPGMELPTECELNPAPQWFTTFPHARRTQPVNALPVTTFTDTPTGVWDVQVCVTDVNAEPGLLTEQTILEQVDGQPPPLFGPVLLTALNSCLSQPRCRSNAECAEGFTCAGDSCSDDEDCGADNRCVESELGMRCEGDDIPRLCTPPPSTTPWTDCDGDGRRGLTSYGEFPDELSTWQACATECDVDGAVGDATCEVAGQVYDCDDDGDGQSDVTEGIACYGLGKGTDSDSDSICDGIDPFPDCRANTAEDCVAGTDDGPQLPDSLQGGVDVVDGGAGDSGSSGVIGDDHTVVPVQVDEWCALQGSGVYANYGAYCFLSSGSGTFGAATCLVELDNPVVDAGTTRGRCGSGGTCDTANAAGAIAPCVYDALAPCANAPCGANFTCDESGGTPECIGDIDVEQTVDCGCYAPGAVFLGTEAITLSAPPAGGSCGPDGVDDQTREVWESCRALFNVDLGIAPPPDAGPSDAGAGLDGGASLDAGP
jgi:hypothetical protein